LERFWRRTINGLAAELIVRGLSGVIDPAFTPDDQQVRR
jgi:hypothetical protein